MSLSGVTALYSGPANLLQRIADASDLLLTGGTGHWQMCLLQ
jgi:hypothetical protein